MKKPFLSLIIPAYNEEKRLPATLQQVADFLGMQTYSSQVLVVENGSSDATYQIASDFAAAHPSFSALQSSARGKGLAVRQGMLTATGEYRMMLDADLSMPVDQINRFIPPALEDVDIAIASREAPGAVRYDEPDYRHIGGRLINYMIRFLVLPGLHDTQCGFKCFRGRVAEDLFAEQRLDGWSFDVELLYIARLRGYSIAEIPIPWYYNEQSHVEPLRDTLQMGVDMLRIRLNGLQGKYGTSD